MNCKDTKNIDIVAFLQKNGFSGVEKGSYVWYCSPLRNEKTPSFSVDPGANRWIDFGTGQRGDLLDLVKLFHSTDTASALKILASINTDESFSFSRPNIQPAQREPGIIIKHVQPIQNKALIQYLNERCIPLNIARRYSQEAYYTLHDKKYFSIAFKNDRGGFELRNRYSKLATSPKYYTYFQVKESSQLNIFEGFFDFLSALTYYNTIYLQYSTIILNSLSFIPPVILLLGQYSQINLFFDNDPESESGQKATQLINASHPKTINHSSIIYPCYKDFNEFIMNTKR